MTNASRFLTDLGTTAEACQGGRPRAECFVRVHWAHRLGEAIDLLQDLRIGPVGPWAAKVVGAHPRSEQVGLRAQILEVLQRFGPVAVCFRDGRRHDGSPAAPRRASTFH